MACTGCAKRRAALSAWAKQVRERARRRRDAQARAKGRRVVDKEPA